MLVSIAGMARQLGEDVGQTIGYRVRFDTRVSSRTRVEVVTEGVLTRMLQSDPSLDGSGMLRFTNAAVAARKVNDRVEADAGPT